MELFYSNKPSKNKELRYFLAFKTAGRCAYCGVKFVYNSKDGYKAHIDHIIPRAKGGSDHQSNLMLACPKCNISKKDKDLSKFKMYKDVDKFFYETVDLGKIMSNFFFNGETTIFCDQLVLYKVPDEMGKCHFSGEMEEPEPKYEYIF